MPDLIRVEWPGRWQEKAPRSHPGRALNSWLYANIARLDEALASELHDRQDAKPFAVALVSGQEEASVTLLVSAYGQLVHVISQLPELVPGRILLDACWLQLGAPTVVSENWPDLAGRALLAVSRAVPVRVHFRTPTTFHSLGRTLPLPVPQLVFGSLLQRWQQWSSIDLGLAAGEVVEKHTAIARHRLRGDVLQLEGRQPAFSGWADFTLVRPPAGYAGLLALLALFGEYAGVGQKTAMGLGNIRAEPRWNS